MQLDPSDEGHDARMSGSEQAGCAPVIGSTAGAFFEPLGAWVVCSVNNLSPLLPHAPSEFLGERDTFHVQKAAASAPVARHTPHGPPLNRSRSLKGSHDPATTPTRAFWSLRDRSHGH